MKIYKLWFLTISFLVLPACQEKIEPGTNIGSRPLFENLDTAAARIKSEPVLYEAVGTVISENTGVLAAKLMARVERIAVREGDQVHTGDILITLDQRQVNAAMQEAKAALSEAQQAMAVAQSQKDAARAAADLSNATYSRYKALKQEDSVSNQEFDEVESRYRQSQAALTQAEAQYSAVTAKVDQAKAALSAAEVALKDTLITAPYSGIIIAKHVDEGDLATPGLPLLTLEMTDKYRLHMELPEIYIRNVHLKQQVQVDIPARNLVNLEGIITTIVPAADPKTRSFLVKIDLPGNIQIKSGMFGRARISLGQSEQLLIPQSAIIRRGQLTGLFIVDPENVVHFRLVRLGKAFLESAEVLSGIKEGEKYVVHPPLTLVDGAQIESPP